MAIYTEKLELFKYDPEVDKKKTFNISQGLNQNWDKLDTTVGELLDANNANTDLSNLTDEGKKHFLNRQQITNCITEIPQRIKYDLTDGTLTIKAGSVVIVPYGVEDLSTTYPVGATFINDNFKVYDAQYADGKFFVWAELVNDIVTNTSVSAGDVATRLTEIDLTRSCANAVINTISSATQYSGTSNCINYRTDLNLVQWTTSGTFTNNVVSLPFLKVTADGANIYGSVQQVFNGMGYIGSTVWADKGIKGLIPNGRNKDGTLKNIEIVSDEIYTLNVTSTSFMLTLDKSGKLAHYYIPFVYKQDTPPDVTTYCFWFDTQNNQWKFHNANVTNWSDFYPLELGEGTLSSDEISDFKVKHTFKAVDYCDFRNLADDVKAKVSSPITALCTTNATTTSSATSKKPAVIVTNYKSGYSWYRIWSDGWKEQGGFSGSAAVNSEVTVTLLKPFSNTNYTVVCSPWTTVGYSPTGNPCNIGTDSFQIHNSSVENKGGSIKCSWYACGY